METKPKNAFHTPLHLMFTIFMCFEVWRHLTFCSVWKNTTWNRNVCRISSPAQDLQNHVRTEWLGHTWMVAPCYTQLHFFLTFTAGLCVCFWLLVVVVADLVCAAAFCRATPQTKKKNDCLVMVMAHVGSSRRATARLLHLFAVAAWAGVNSSVAGHQHVCSACLCMQPNQSPSIPLKTQYSVKTTNLSLTAFIQTERFWVPSHTNQWVPWVF